MSSIFAPISSSAWSQVIRWYLPSTSFIGYFSRCESLGACHVPAPRRPSRSAPRFIGESNTGSCRTHTPFFTTASTAQPTEQCVQTVRCVPAHPCLRRSCRGRLCLADGTVRKAAQRKPRHRQSRRSVSENFEASINRPALHAGHSTCKSTLGHRGPRRFLRKHRESPV